MTTYEQGLAANFGLTPRPEGGSRGSDLGLSLPIRDHLSAKVCIFDTYFISWYCYAGCLIKFMFCTV